MKVKNVMTKNVEAVKPDSTVKEAAQKMKDLNTGVLPVCDGESLTGMLTDRDIAVRSTAKRDNPNNTKVRDVMSSSVEWCYEDESMEKVAQHMEKRQIRRLAVMTRKKKLVGMVSLGDMVTRGSKKLACEALEKISEPVKV